MLKNLMQFTINVNLKICGLENIMATLDEVLAGQDQIKADLAAQSGKIDEVKALVESGAGADQAKIDAVAAGQAEIATSVGENTAKLDAILNPV